jgi:hypothetical protein
MICRGPGFLLSYDSVSRPTLPTMLPAPTLYRQQVVSLSQSSFVSPVELTDGRKGGRGRASRQIIRRRENMALHESFNTLCNQVFIPEAKVLVILSAVFNLSSCHLRLIIGHAPHRESAGSILNNMSHGQNLSSSSGEPEFVVQ